MEASDIKEIAGGGQFCSRKFELKKKSTYTSYAIVLQEIISLRVEGLRMYSFFELK